MGDLDLRSLTELSLFSGYGGFSLGLRLSGLEVQTVCYVEIDAYCQKLIQARIRDGYLDDAPIWDDIRTFDGRPWRENVDLLTAGFPCQPHSVAGQRRGADDERNLWPATLRVIREVGPRYVLLENVPGILANGYGGTVVGQLSEAGYDCIWDCVSAAEVGAPHLRLRWWCLAYAQEFVGRWKSQLRSELALSPGTSSSSQALAHTAGRRLERCRNFLRDNGEAAGRRKSQSARDGAGIHSLADSISERQQTGRTGGSDGISVARKAYDGPKTQSSGNRARTDWWSVEPDVGRVAHGVASRVDRLRAIGNGIVPAVVKEVLMEGLDARGQ